MQSLHQKKVQFHWKKENNASGKLISYDSLIQASILKKLQLSSTSLY
jgi:hypothetical protein